MSQQSAPLVWLMALTFTMAHLGQLAGEKPKNDVWRARNCH
jgi:hypothetical protein